MAAIIGRRSSSTQSRIGKPVRLFSCDKETRLEEARPKNNAAIIGISSNEPLGVTLPAREAAVQFVWEMVRPLYKRHGRLVRVFKVVAAITGRLSSIFQFTRHQTNPKRLISTRLKKKSLESVNNLSTSSINSNRDITKQPTKYEDGTRNYLSSPGSPRLR